MTVYALAMPWAQCYRAAMAKRMVAVRAVAGMCVAWAAVWAAPVGAQEVLRASVSTAWNMPFGRVENERLMGGIYADILGAVAQKMQLVLLPVVLPRKRIEGAVVSGDIDLRCYFNPEWTPNPTAYEWSKPLFSLRDVLFAPQGTPELLSLDAIPHGTPVSTTLGYVYPSLEARFKRGALVRDDSVDEEKVLLKMTAERTPLGLTNSHALDWYRKNVPKHKLAPWQFVVHTTDIFCAVPKNAAIPASRTLAAIEDLRKSGRIDAMLRAYR